MTYPVLCVKQPVKERFTKVYRVVGYSKLMGGFYPLACGGGILFESESFMEAQHKLEHILEREKEYVKSVPHDFARYVKFTIESYWKSTPKEEYKIVPEVLYVEQ
mgnify:CR=1 FL=1